MLELVHLTGATRVHHLKRKDQVGHVEYWKAQCGESRMLRLGGGKERKLLPIRTLSTMSDRSTLLHSYARHGYKSKNFCSK